MKISTYSKSMALAQRIMDDIIDLELGKIKKIIAKIDSRSESEEVKEAETFVGKKFIKERTGKTYRRRYHS